MESEAQHPARNAVPKRVMERSPHEDVFALGTIPHSTSREEIRAPVRRRRVSRVCLQNTHSVKAGRTQAPQRPS